MSYNHLQDVERLLRSGDIPTIAPQNAKRLLADENLAYKLLDVRPMWEREKAYVAGSIHVPLFVEDEATDAVTLLKKQIQFGFGGAWLGQRFTKPNVDFLAQVEEALPRKDEKVLVACGEGMRLVSQLSSVDINPNCMISSALPNPGKFHFEVSRVCAEQVHDGHRGAAEGRVCRIGLASRRLQQCARWRLRYNREWH